MALTGLIMGNVIPIASGWYKAAVILAIMLSAFGFPVLFPGSPATSAHARAYALSPETKRSAARMLGMLAAVAVAIVVALMLFTGCSGSPRVVAGEKAAAACAIGDVLKYGGDLQTALSKPDYETQVKAVATKAGLTNDAIACLINTVLAVVTTPSGSGASTSEPTPTVLHGRAWIAAHGTP